MNKDGTPFALVSMDKGQWKTRDGRTLAITDMTTGHLKNTAAFLQRRLDRGDYRRPHQCMVVDISDGPCFDCSSNFIRKCRWQDKIAEFEAELETRDILRAQVLVDRLREYVNPYFNFDIAPFSLEEARRAEPHNFAEFVDRDPAYHARRVRAILDKIEDGWEMDAIWVGSTLQEKPMAIIADGHHRFVTALLLNRDTITIEYNGRLDVLEYLTGESDKAP